MRRRIRSTSRGQSPAPDDVRPVLVGNHAGTILVREQHAVPHPQQPRRKRCQLGIRSRLAAVDIEELRSDREGATRTPTGCGWSCGVSLQMDFSRVLTVLIVPSRRIESRPASHSWRTQWSTQACFRCPY